VYPQITEQEQPENDCAQSRNRRQYPQPIRSRELLDYPLPTFRKLQLHSDARSTGWLSLRLSPNPRAKSLTESAVALLPPLLP
jgi:hypothetical protein